MNENIINALMKLFAIVANVDEEGLSPKAVNVLQNYLETQLNKELAENYKKVFISYLELYNARKQDKVKNLKKLSLNSVKVLAICNEINEELQQSDKIIVILRLLEFISQDQIKKEELEFIQTVAEVFNISRAEYDDLFNFVLHNYQKIKNKNNLLIVSSEKTSEEIKFIKETSIDGYLQFLYIESTNLIIFKYIGNDTLKLNSYNINANQTYVFDQGSVIKSPKISPLYYSEIFTKLRNIKDEEKIVYCAKDIEFYYNNTNTGIHPFSIYETSGRLVGIMGGSGAGKSTLLNILIGNFKTHKGIIRINGYDLYKDHKKLEGIIGYVPQDDMLIEELTVFQNLYFNAKLCFRNLNKYAILRRVIKILKELDLYEIRNLKVGSILNRFISGGQRKRLNIALELVREPAILFVDEPTSGLSSADSENVMLILKEQTYKGKLVFVNIHQPFSDIYKLFDKIIIIDKGGYPIYYGNPIEAIAYFRRHNKIANAEDVVCPTCGNVNSEQILELVESKFVNEYGKITEKRKFSPLKWYNLFKENIQSLPQCSKDEFINHRPLPKTIFQKASKFEQFIIFFVRNLLQKISNKQYLIINTIQAPLLAVILALFSKFKKGTDFDPDKYLFIENENIPAFLFMAVTVALFLGLIISAEEIIKDRKILRREKFLNLSKVTYLNSKIFYLSLISAIQTFLFTFISCEILEIKGLLWKFWLILFVTSLWANMVGLIISSSLNSVVAIYISIPLVLIPQLLLSGTVLNFSKIYKPFTSEKYVPILGDIIVSRWAYEALMVTQFSDNNYEKYFFEYDKMYENANFYSSTYYNKIEQIVNFLSIYMKDPKYEKIVNRRFQILINEIKKVEKITGKKFPNIDKINKKEFNEIIRQKILDYFYINVKIPNLTKASFARNKKDSIVYALSEKLGSYEKISELKEKNFNSKVEEMVTQKTDFESIIEGNNELIRKYRPVYQIPESKIGRAQFYASEKIIGKIHIKTLWFNVLVILLFTFVLYILLVSQILDVDHNFLKKNKI